VFAAQIPRTEDWGRVAERWKTKAIVLGIAVWLGGVLTAFVLVWSYKTKPGNHGLAPERWPRASAIAIATDKANLVMFAHPQCPCTRASVAELARLATQIGSRAQIHVVLVRPPGTDPGFEDGTLAERARAIPDARVIVDDGGREADRFGAQTSGATLLYRRDGRLGFSGGITTARGHEGRGPAHTRILTAIEHDAPDEPAHTPTFGCELANKDTLDTTR
jgi:hypothetical protein